MDKLCGVKRTKLIETTYNSWVDFFTGYTYEELKSIANNAYWFLEGEDANLMTFHLFSNPDTKEVEYVVCNLGSDIFDCLKLNNENLIATGGYVIEDNAGKEVVNPVLDVFKEDLVNSVLETYNSKGTFNRYGLPKTRIVNAIDKEIFAEYNYQRVVSYLFDEMGASLKFFIDQFRDEFKNIKEYRVSEKSYLPDVNGFDPILNGALLKAIGINTTIPIEKYMYSKEQLEYYQIKEKQVDWTYALNAEFCGFWNAVVDTVDGIAMLLPSLYKILSERATFKQFFRLIIDFLMMTPQELGDLFTEYDFQNSKGSVYRLSYQQCYEVSMILSLFLPSPKIGKAAKVTETLEEMSVWLSNFSAKNELIVLAYKMGLRVEKTAGEWKLVFGKYTLLKGQKEKVLQMVEDIGEISKFEGDKNLAKLEKELNEAVIEENGVQRKLTKAEKKELLRKLRYEGGAFGDKSVVETAVEAEVKAFEEGEIQFANKTIAEPFDKIKEAISYFNHHVVDNIVKQLGEDNCGNVAKVIVEYLRTGELRLAEDSLQQGLEKVAEKCGAGRFSDITGLDRLEFLLREDEIAILYGARRYHSSGLVEGHYLAAVKVEKKVYLLEGQTGEILLYDKTSIESKNFERGYRQFKYTKAGKIKK